MEKDLWMGRGGAGLLGDDASRRGHGLTMLFGISHHSTRLDAGLLGPVVSDKIGRQCQGRLVGLVLCMIHCDRNNNPDQRPSQPARAMPDCAPPFSPRLLTHQVSTVVISSKSPIPLLA